MGFLSRIMVVVIIFGAVLGFLGFKEWRLGQVASPTPQKITCAQLERNGPGDNAHVEMSGFLLCPSGFVYKGKKGDSSTWSVIWVPAVPLDGEYVRQMKQAVASRGDQALENFPPPKNVKLIVKSSHVRNQQEFEQFGDRGSLGGLIVNKVESLGSEERNLLASSYPGIDFSTCYILEEGRKPKSAGAAAGMMGGGGLLVLGGLLGMIRGMRSS
jgi:hypothetical protein